MSIKQEQNASNSPPKRMEPRKRVKKYLPKVRTGCITCKKRHVKCDEGKPSCLRCVKIGKECEGYLPEPKPWLFEPGDSSANTSTVSTPSLSHLTLSASRSDLIDPALLVDAPVSWNPSFGNTDEIRLLDLYLNLAAPHIASYSNAQLWSNIIPQLSWHSPAIKSSLLALASTYEAAIRDPETLLQPAGRPAFYYNEAIRTITNGQLPVEQILLTCILFFTLENINGRTDVSFTHLTAGVRMLKEWKLGHWSRLSAYSQEMLRDYIEPTFREILQYISVMMPRETAHEIIQAVTELLALPTPVPRRLSLTLPEGMSPGSATMESLTQVHAPLYQDTGVRTHLTVYPDPWLQMLRRRSTPSIDIHPHIQLQSAVAMILSQMKDEGILSGATLEDAVYVGRFNDVFIRLRAYINQLSATTARSLEADIRRLARHWQDVLGGIYAFSESESEKL